MKIDKDILEKLLVGCSFLGTGGGGRIDVAKNLLKQINRPVELIELNDIKDSGIIITTFGVGGLKKYGDFKKTNKSNLEVLSGILKKEINYLIPVEIGPVSVINIFLTASLLNIPVINADLVGFRSSPEIYLEGISLNNVNRLPLVASNSEGDSLVLLKVEKMTKIEDILRQFSTLSKTKVYVAGYPLSKKKIIKNCGINSLSYSIKIGTLLSESTNKTSLISSLKREGIDYVGEGIIIDQVESELNGFTSGKIVVKALNDLYEIIYKNENLILLKNKKIITTCPDSVLLLDIKRKIGVNNGDMNIGKKVLIFKMKSQIYWRSKRGLKLFSPKNIGFNFEQKIY